MNNTNEVLYTMSASVWPNRLQNILNVRGDTAIDNINVQRKPLNKALEILANIATFGAYNKALSNLKYDHFFHLYIRFQLSNNYYVYVEKNQTIVVRYVGQALESSQSEVLPINTYITNSKSLFEFFKNASDKIDYTRLKVYDVVKTNCQVFVTDLLAANNLMTPAYYNWINQTITNAIGPTLNKILNKITGLAGTVDNVIDSNVPVKPLQTQTQHTATPLQIQTPTITTTNNSVNSNIIMSEQINIDISTTGLASGTNPGITGDKNNFTVHFPGFNLPNANYLLTVADFSYPTVDLSGGALPGTAAYNYAKSVRLLVACDLVQPIVVQGKYGSLIYKSAVGSQANDYIIDDLASSPQMMLKVNSDNFSSINVQIIRSDTGALYPFTSLATEGPVSIIFQIVPMDTNIQGNSI